jgi:hypothetical protein
MAAKYVIRFSEPTSKIERRRELLMEDESWLG